MDDTICGHERGSLRITLEWLVTAKYMPWEAIAREALSREGVSRENCPDSARVVDLYDPAILAEMLASEQRRLELAGTARLHKILIDVHHPMLPDGHINVPYTMPQARDILAAWLVLHDGAREQAGSALCGVS